MLKFPKKCVGWVGSHTVRLVTAPNVKRNNNRISAIRAECAGGDVEIGTPVYGSTTIDVSVKVSTRGLMLIVR